MSWAYDVSLACRFVVGTVFAASFFTKTRSREAWLSFRSWLGRLPLPLVRLKSTPVIFAVAEAIVIVLVITPDTATGGLAASATLGAILTYGLVVSLRRGSREPCHCFGSSSEPLSWAHVGRNVLLLAVAASGTACSASGASAGPSPALAMAAFAGLGCALCVIFFTDIAALWRPARAAAANGVGSHAHANPR
jgi:hypothetical protein